MFNFVILSLIFLQVFTQTADSNETPAPPSIETQSITACWLLTVQDHTVDEEAFEKFYEDLVGHNLTIHEAQVYMIKKCYQHIKNEDVLKIIESVENDVIEPLTYRDIVKDFEYDGFLENFNKNGTKHQRIDDIILLIIKELENQYGMNYDEELEDGDDEQNVDL